MKTSGKTPPRGRGKTAPAAAKKWSGSTITKIREHLKISNEKLAPILGTTTATVGRWEHGKTKPRPLAQKRLRNMLRIIEQIRYGVSPPRILAWLQTPDPDLFDLPPLDLLASDYATTLLANTLAQMQRGAG
jgi:DNA-binding transcriptional regulator YiaG